MAKKANQAGKKKQKMVFAKDPKQAALAIIVMVIFVLNGIYMLAKYLMETYAPVQQSSQATEEVVNEDGTISTTNNKSQNASSGGTEPVLEQNAPPTPAQATQSTLPIIPIVAVLAVLAIGGGITFFIIKSKQNQSGSSSSTDYQKALNEASGDSRRKSGKKGKMELAKDPKQALLAIVVMIIFVGNGIYMLAKYLMETYAPVASSDPQAAQMAEQQQQSLESLNNSSSGSSAGNSDIAQDANDIYSQTMNGQSPQGVPGVNQHQEDNNIEIMSQSKGIKKSGKTVMITVSNSGRTNPFLPAAENYSPTSSAYLTSPPETLPSDSDAGKIMKTTISGILYDKYSPSAILNIEGTDYLVKRGDIINKYKILGITRNEVLVQLGKNVYKAGVGELLSLTDMNFNTVANLNKKFGGNNIPISVRKKGY